MKIRGRKKEGLHVRRFKDGKNGEKSAGGQEGAGYQGHRHPPGDGDRGLFSYRGRSQPQPGSGYG